jgi:hypothetical protein
VPRSRLGMRRWRPTSTATARATRRNVRNGCRWRPMSSSESGGDSLLAASLSPDGRRSGADGAEWSSQSYPAPAVFGGGPRCGRDVRVTSPVGREWSAMRNVDDAGHRQPTTTTSGTALSLRRTAKPRRRIDDFTASSPAQQRPFSMHDHGEGPPGEQPAAVAGNPPAYAPSCR